MGSSMKATSRLLSTEPSREVPFIYGTAWKKNNTKELVKLAIVKGFRKIDTAAQPKHYQEPLVGVALRELFQDGLVKREEIYLQTKYTTPAGQDLNNIPYDPSAPLATQIHTSVASSLKNLRHQGDSQEEAYIDCLLLHSPLPTIEQTLEAWKILESYVPHRIRTLGVSNTTLQALQAIQHNSFVKPSVIQNRFYSQTQFDGPLRFFCYQHGISYQSFWTLTGNPNLLKADCVGKLASSVGVSRSVALYALVMDQGIVVLNGTTSPDHMEEDICGIPLVHEWVLAHKKDWLGIRQGFIGAIQPQAL